MIEGLTVAGGRRGKIGGPEPSPPQLPWARGDRGHLVHGHLASPLWNQHGDSEGLRGASTTFPPQPPQTPQPLHPISRFRFRRHPSSELHLYSSAFRLDFCLILGDRSHTTAFTMNAVRGYHHQLTT